MSSFGKPPFKGASPFFDGNNWEFGLGLPPFNGDDRSSVNIQTIPFINPLSMASDFSNLWVACITGSDPDLVRLANDGSVDFHVPAPSLGSGARWTDLVFDDSDTIWLQEITSDGTFIRPLTSSTATLGSRIKVSNSIASAPFRIIISQFDNTVWTSDSVLVIKVTDTTTPGGATTSGATSSGQPPLGMVYDAGGNNAVWVVSLNSAGTAFVLDNFDPSAVTAIHSLTVTPFGGDQIINTRVALTASPGFVWVLVSSFSSAVKLYRIDVSNPNAPVVSGTPLDLVGTSTLAIATDLTYTTFFGGAVFVVGSNFQSRAALVQVDPTTITVTTSFPILPGFSNPNRLKVSGSSGTLAVAFPDSNLLTQNSLFDFNLQLTSGPVTALTNYVTPSSSTQVFTLVNASLGISEETGTETDAEFIITPVFPFYTARVIRVSLYLQWSIVTGTLHVRLVSNKNGTITHHRLLGDFTSTGTGWFSATMFRTGQDAGYISVNFDGSNIASTYSIPEGIVVVEDLGPWNG